MSCYKEKITTLINSCETQINICETDKLKNKKDKKNLLDIYLDSKLKDRKMYHY